MATEAEPATPQHSDVTRRTWLAAERTWLAWWRTGIGASAVAIGVGQFLNTGSGYLGGSESNGSYVSLKSTNGTDYSTIIETTTAAAAQTVNVSVSGGLSTGTVHVWATNVNAPTAANTFVQQASITPSIGAYSLTVQPGYIVSLTTTTGQGKGTAASPSQGTLTLPYSARR